MKKSYDKLSQRIVLIIMKLNNGERFSAKDLAQEFNVDKRTVQRDLNERLAFLPIEKNGKYYSLADYALGKLSYKDIQNFAVFSGIQSLYPELDSNIIADALNTKLNKAYMIKNQGFEKIDSKRNMFDELAGSISRTSPVNFTYSNKQRHVNPYKLVNNDGVWYLLADENGKLKTFSLSKIENFSWKDRDAKFSPKQDFLDQIAKNDTNWFSKDMEVILQIDNKAQKYFFRKQFLANHKILKENEKYFIISTKVGFDDEVLKVVKYWLPYIKILKPQKLKNKFEKMLVNYLKI